LPNEVRGGGSTVIGSFSRDWGKGPQQGYPEKTLIFWGKIQGLEVIFRGKNNNNKEEEGSGGNQKSWVFGVGP